MQAAQRVAAIYEFAIKLHQITLHEANLRMPLYLKWSDVKYLNITKAGYMGDETFDAATYINVTMRVSFINH